MGEKKQTITFARLQHKVFIFCPEREWSRLNCLHVHSDRHADTILMILEWNIRAFIGTYSTITAVSSDIVSPLHAVINNSVLVIKIFCLIVKTNLSGSLNSALIWKEKKKHFWFSLDKSMVENIQKRLRFFIVPSLNIVRICSSKNWSSTKAIKLLLHKIMWN